MPFLFSFIFGVLLCFPICSAKCQAREAPRLHIGQGISDQEYREQALGLTPLGTGYNGVKSFLREEWKRENRNVKSAIYFGKTTLYKEYVSLGRHQLLEKEPPHINIKDYEHPFNAQKGRTYMVSKFYCRLHWWMSEVCVGMIYVFDAKKILGDIFATARPVNNHPLGDL